MRDYERTVMNLKFWNNEPSIYDRPIEKVLDAMDMYNPDDPEWPALMANLKELSDRKARSWKDKVSPDTIAIVAGNLLGILIIVAYEQSHPMVSKGLNYVKPQT